MNEDEAVMERLYLRARIIYGLQDEWQLANA
jgi:hypothetical protein